MESEEEKLEGGADDTWFHDSIDGEFDNEWRAAIITLLAKENGTVSDKVQY